MEYPGSKLTRPIRLAIMIIFIISFFVISPLILLYTDGYRFDWQNGIFKETGGISIDILPANATVALNGIKLKGSMPYRLKNITPDTYTITLSSAGYFEWQKEVTVKNKETVYIKDIRMIKKNKPELVRSGNISGLALSGDGAYLAFAESSAGANSAWLENNATGQAVQIADTNKKTAPLNISWNYSGRYFVVAGGEKPYDSLSVVAAGSPQNSVDVAKSAGKIYKFQWKDNPTPQLLFETSSTLYSFLPESGRTIAVAPNNFIDWYMSGNELWILKPNTSTQGLAIIKDALGFSAEIGGAGGTTGGNWQISLARGNSVLIGKEGDSARQIFTADASYDLSGEKYLISPFNDWWIIWTPSELWTYSEGTEPQLLSRSGNKLLEVTPLDQNNTLALSWADKVTALYPYYYITHDLLNEPVKSMAADTANRILYYSDAKGLWKLGY